MLSYFLIVVGLLSTASCHSNHHHHAIALARSVVAAASSASSVSVASGQTPAAVANPTASLVGPSAPPLSGVNTATTSQLPDATLTATDPNIPPLSDLTSGLPSSVTPIFTFTAQLGAPGPFPGAPPLPTTTLDRSKYPSPTQNAPTDHPLMSEWLKELEGHQIPDIPPNTNNSECALNPEAARDASRCWWTCGGCTNPTDIVTCNDKDTWGLTFDDGPSPFTPTEENLNATFFAIAGNIYWFNEIAVEAYLQGHQLALHTWHHQYMTTLTTEEVVAEIGFARMMMKDVFGVTPSYWRPPYGDVDERVRAIALAMGMQTIIWTRNPSTLDQFDTNDWRIPAGQVTGPQAFQQFEAILTNASVLNTGFIVLEHDLYPQTVDFAVGYTLPTALASTNPTFTLKPVIECLHLPMSEAYNETRTQPLPQFVTSWHGEFINVAEIVTQSNSNLTTSSSGGDGDGSGSSSEGSSGSSSGSSPLSVSLSNVILAAVVSILAVALKS
ncbi:hypothetical protein Clacol_007844 [Clathrus columnatus]|uniref:chitin deacetylase n=1 Tax=Clathrus columnatus TaxID=1419009 RepID=A0AAV5ALM8_9AGAM|nr:hypothetical protein Clacol_007844 [Clathrus columnatus]